MYNSSYICSAIGIDGNHKSKKMTTQTAQNTNAKFTDLELDVIIAISNGDEFDGKPCQCIGNISDLTGIDNKILRGVLSSLMQKDAITVGEYPNGSTAFYLNA